MSATDELRRLLDERGVEWTAPNSGLRDETTMWVVGGFDYEAFEFDEPDGTFLLEATHQDYLTPEQAVEATLGSIGCEFCMNGKNGFDGQTVMMSNHGWQRVKYCPNCGRKVVDE